VRSSDRLLGIGSVHDAPGGVSIDPGSVIPIDARFDLVKNQTSKDRLVTDLDVTESSDSAGWDECIPLGTNAYLRLRRGGKALPVVHLQIYADEESARRHSMVSGFFTADDSDEGPFMLRVPIGGGRAAFLVLERHVSFSVCLIGGTGVGKS
jgi:hypothetical protein